MMKIKQVLWDWNGTLLDDLEYSIQVRNNIFPAFHLPLLDSVIEQLLDLNRMDSL